MSIKAVFTWERNHNRTMYNTEREFTDENHLKNYVRKCMTTGDASKPKYINHKIIHENEKPIFNLNDAEKIFSNAKDGKYESLRELLLNVFKIRI